MAKKYIDADHLKAEIEKHIKEVKNAAEKFTLNMGFFDAKLSGIYDVMAIIDSLQQEQQEVDYEKDLTEWMGAGPHTCYPWCTIPDAIKITAEHFYELGLKA